jgi:hypothetical protein
VLEESTVEITGRVAESALKKERKHHNFIGIGCEKIFTGGGMPLQHGAIREKVIHNELVNLAFIRNGRL